MKEANIINFIIKSKNHYCLWYSEYHDLFLVENNKIIYFKSKSELMKKYENVFDICNEIIIMDVNEITQLEEIDYYKNCDLLLDFWNNMSDLAKSLKFNFYGDIKEKNIDIVYNKIFYGTNPPSLNQTNKTYIPDFNKSETKIISKVISNGLLLINRVFN